MFRKVQVLVLMAVPSAGFALIDLDTRIMGRGDANNDRTVNMTDAIMINNYLFNGGMAPPCLNQADANSDGVVNMADSSFILNWYFNGGYAPPSPGPFNKSCTVDPLPSPGCLIDPCH